ncbi:MAG: ferritin family protein [Phycisphaerae bacterium]|jgi:rubrerythrin
MSYLADYALQVAMQMEQLGQTFYKSLSAGCGNAKIAALAGLLAREEENHFLTFEKMRNAIPAEERGPKMTEDQITAAAGKFYKLILPSPADVRKVADSGNVANALDMAMQMESDSIAYYSSLLSVVGRDGAILKAVIKEEEKHLAILHDYRKRITA